MDINSFITGFAMGKKKGGSAVLGELVVVENGVYDKPMVDGKPADGWNKVIVDITGTGSDGTGNDSVVVDVEEFPTENIDPNTIYRIVEDSVSIWLTLSAEGVSGDFSDVAKLFAGESVVCEYFMVDTMPDEPMDVIPGVAFYVYIVRSENFAPKISLQGNVYDLGMAVGGVEYKGVISDSTQALEDGVYAIPATTVRIGVPNADGAKHVYQYGTKWENASAALVINTKLEADVESLKTKVADKNKTIAELTPHANFAKYVNLTYSTRYTGSYGVGITSVSDITFDGGMEIPDYVVGIDDNAFKSCHNMDSVTFPNGLRMIGAEAFAYCTDLKPTLRFGTELVKIGYKAFYNCIGVESVIFSMPSYSNISAMTIGSEAFGLNQQLKDIYVPWSEGEVAGAPWGATKATIHYNHTP